MILNILMSVWGARIDSMNENAKNDLRAVQPQCYPNDCRVTTTTPQGPEKAIYECKSFANKHLGLFFAGEKNHLFVNTFADRAHLDGISVTENTLSL